MPSVHYITFCFVFFYNHLSHFLPKWQAVVRNSYSRKSRGKSSIRKKDLELLPILQVFNFFYLTTRSCASSTTTVLEWNKVTFKDLSVSAMTAFAGELEKLGVFWKLKNQEVEGLLDFYIFVSCFKPNLNSGTEIHPTWNNTVEIIVLTQSCYRHWWTQFKLLDDCGGQIIGRGPLTAVARVTLWPFVEHLNRLGYLLLNLSVTDD